MPLAASLLYCDEDDVIARYDERKVRAYCVDDDSTDPDTILLDESTILLAAIADATGYINMMVQRGKRYSIQEIKDALLINPDTLVARFPETKAQIVRLCVDLTMANLMRRRLMSEEAIRAALPSFEMTMDTLALLQDGKAIFDISGHIDASVPGTYDPYPERNLPSKWNPMYGSFGGNRYVC